MFNDSSQVNRVASNVFNQLNQGLIQENAMKDKKVHNSPYYEQILNDNENGDAKIFIGNFRNKFCYDTAETKWYLWAGHFWEKDFRRESVGCVDVVVQFYKDKLTEIRAEINLAYQNDDESTARKLKKVEADFQSRIKLLNTNARRNNILSLAATGKDSLAIKGDEWDRHPMLLPCSNGVVDLETGQLKSSSPADYLKTAAPTEWQGLDCPAPTWEQFLLQIFDGDEEIVAYLHRLLGYAITGMTTEHILPVFCGQGRNGKGTIFEVLGRILGDIAKPCSPELLVEFCGSKSGSAASPDIMDLMGRRIAWTSETDGNRSFNMAKVKRLTGNDSLKGRHLFKGMVTFDPTHKLFLLTNNKPHADANDYAFWKRLQLLNFPISFVDDPVKDNERQRDPYLMNKLLGEKSGILAWLVNGCLEWQNINISPPDKVLRSSMEYQAEEDIIGAFINEVCLITPSSKISSTLLYEEYKKWAVDSGHRPLSQTKFGKKMILTYQKLYINGNYFYQGLSPKS